MTEFYDIARKDSRQRQIEALEIGDSVAVARRVEIRYGIAEGALQAHRDQMRGIIDQQCHRARRKLPTRKFTVENGSFMTSAEAIMLVAVVTRTA